MHLVDLKLTTLNFTLFLLKEEVLFELKLAGLCYVISLWVDATDQLFILPVVSVMFLVRIINLRLNILDSQKTNKSI